MTKPVLRYRMLRKVGYMAFRCGDPLVGPRGPAKLAPSKSCCIAWAKQMTAKESTAMGAYPITARAVYVDEDDHDD